MIRNYIGVACTGHDNSIAIVNSRGDVVFAEATERYLQNKRALGYPAEDMIRTGRLIDQYCEAGAEIVVAKTWSDEAPGFLRRETSHVDQNLQLLRAGGAAFASILEQARRYRYILSLVLRSQEGVGGVIAEHCAGTRRVTVKAYNHHLTHAATCLHSGPKSDAVCAIVDGAGESMSTSFYSYRDGNIETVDAHRTKPGQAPGLGLFYAAICVLCGFNAWQGEEWKVMGLAPYGKKDHTIYDLMRKSLVVKGLRIESHPERVAAWKALETFGRKPGAPASDVADLAHTVQLFFSDIMSELLNNLYELRISDNLVLGGGCALNSSYNGQILARTPFRHLHVNFAPADDGNAIGAALLAYQEDHPRESRQKIFQSPYLGSTMSEEVLNNVKRFNPTLNVSTWPNEISKKAAELIAGGAIIAWVQDRAEFGPRALGNRSILADPRPATMKDAINARVKFREEFRPLAPSILHEYGDEYFIDYQESPYMERTLLFRDTVRDKVPAVVHVDGSGRLQTVKREWNERYYDLILEFHKLTGIPLVLNTSFNVMGKPIVHSVEDAMAVFFTSGLDALIINDCLIQK